MPTPQWHDLGSVEELNRSPLTEVKVNNIPIALSCVDGQFGAISAVCNHVGAPLGQGRLDGDYVVCPWHNWKFHRCAGHGQPPFEKNQVPRYEVKTENGRVLIDLNSATQRRQTPHQPHPLSRPIQRPPGEARVAGISTTPMDLRNPRYSTSEALLEEAMRHAANELIRQTTLVRLAKLQFHACEGYYSKAAAACTWPCSITQMHPDDQLDQIYEIFVHWADVILIATPIRWGNASSLYYKMAERMNCIQNQVTLSNRVLLRNKVVGFIITGGQDNIQAVAGQMLSFFAELGCVFPQFPYIGHSRGWTAEDMENNVAFVQESAELKAGARSLVERCIHMAERLLASGPGPADIALAGRKAHPCR